MCITSVGLLYSVVEAWNNSLVEANAARVETSDDCLIDIKKQNFWSYDFLSVYILQWLNAAFTKSHSSLVTACSVPINHSFLTRLLMENSNHSLKNISFTKHMFSSNTESNSYHFFSVPPTTKVFFFFFFFGNYGSFKFRIVACADGSEKHQSLSAV